MAASATFEGESTTALRFQRERFFANILLESVQTTLLERGSDSWGRFSVLLCGSTVDPCPNVSPGALRSLPDIVHVRLTSDFEVDSLTCCLVRQWIHFPSHSLNDGITRATNVIIVGKHGSVCGYGLHLPKVTHCALQASFKGVLVSTSLFPQRAISTSSRWATPHTHCVGQKARVGPNTQDRAEHLVATTGHLFAEMMAARHHLDIAARVAGESSHTQRAFRRLRRNMAWNFTGMTSAVCS